VETNIFGRISEPAALTVGGLSIFGSIQKTTSLFKSWDSASITLSKPPISISGNPIIDCIAHKPWHEEEWKTQRSIPSNIAHNEQNRRRFHETLSISVIDN
jgi:hypothetical protein